MYSAKTMKLPNPTPAASLGTHFCWGRFQTSCQCKLMPLDCCVTHSQFSKLSCKAQHVDIQFAWYLAMAGQHRQFGHTYNTIYKRMSPVTLSGLEKKTGELVCDMVIHLLSCLAGSGKSRQLDLLHSGGELRKMLKRTGLRKRHGSRG